MKIERLTVDRAQAGRSLRDFLADALGVSKNRAKAIVDGRNVYVNRQRVWMARHELAAGDRIEIAQQPETAPEAARLPILFEDDHYLVVDKPAGILSNGPNSAESVLREKRATAEAELDSKIMSVHRLDRDTSGCLLLAKSPRAFDMALQLFRERGVNKAYHVIAAGQVTPGERIIAEPIEGKRATTKLKTISSNRAASHLLVSIETGRTHQIRKHLASIGNPVLGDSHYGAQSEATPKSLSATRQMLHASSLEFTNPATGRQVRVSARLPDDFRDCLRAFKLN